MFDVIVNDARKYAPNAGKLEAKADQCFEKLNVITIAQITTERGAVKTLGDSTCKVEFTSDMG